MVARTVHFDDLDYPNEVEAAVTGFEFSLDGKTYEIDLSAEHLAELQAAVKPFVEAARRSGASNLIQMPRSRQTPSSGRAPAKVDREQAKAMRAWLQRHGFKVSDRGRIPLDMQEAYHNRDPRTGEPAANETARRTEAEASVTEDDSDKKYAESKEAFREAAQAWGRANGYEIGSRGFGLPPTVVKKFSRETGLYPPQESRVG